MALPVKRPLNDVPHSVSTSSIATTPVAASVVATTAGYLQRVFATAGGTTTGTITVTVTVNGGSDVTAGAFAVPAGSGARNNPAFEFALVGAGVTSGIYLSEGDTITFTPSGGTGASITGQFAAVIRAI